MRRNSPSPNLGIDSQRAGVRSQLLGLVGSPGPAVSVLAWIGALLLVLSAIIHLHLWSQSYQHIPTIGPLFLVQGIAGIVLAVTVSVFRRLLVLGAWVRTRQRCKADRQHSVGNRRSMSVGRS